MFAGLVPEEDVIGAVGVEGRVQVDQVYRLRRHVLPENVQVIAIEKGVLGYGFTVHIFPPMPSLDQISQRSRYINCTRWNVQGRIPV